jgi:hypothetical protein
MERLLDQVLAGHGRVQDLVRQGEYGAIRGRKRRAASSNGSPARHTRAVPCGLALVNTRRMRSPRFGRDGNASTCSRRSSARSDWTRVDSSARRKLVGAGRKCRS